MPYKFFDKYVIICYMCYPFAEEKIMQISPN